MSTYVIGDLQGCYTAFQKLLKHIHFNVREDELWLVGDLVNRGPHSLDVLKYLMDFPGKLTCVLGNHDLHLIALAVGAAKHRPSDTLQEVLQDPHLPQIITWLRQQKLLHYSEKFQTFLVHAGIYPFWSITQAIAYAREFEEVLVSAEWQNFLPHMYGNVPAHWSDELEYWSRLRFIVNAFTRMRILDANGGLDLKFKGTANDIPSGAQPWFNLLLPEYRTQRIVFGHWAALRGVTRVPNVFALDTGCVWGETLTAMRLEDERCFSVEG